MKISDKTKYRILEIIPGALVWVTFILAISLSFLKPLWVIYFVIVFCIYWLFRAFYFVFYLAISWRRFKKDVKTSWWEKVQKLPDWQDYYHLEVLPTSKEPIEVLRPTFQNLEVSHYSLDKMIVVLSGEERNKETFYKTRLRQRCGLCFCD